jgi:hypothetical protein
MGLRGSHDPQSLSNILKTGVAWLRAMSRETVWAKKSALISGPLGAFVSQRLWWV